MEDLNSVVAHLSDAKRILLTGSPKISYDELASLVALDNLFREQGKETKVAFSEDIGDARGRLVDRSTTRISRSLEPLFYTISIPYEKGEVEKVSYDSADGKINLHITPGESDFDFNKVKYSVGGSNFDTIIVVGCKTLNWIGDVYKKNQKSFEKITVINLNNRRGYTKFGDLTVNMFNKQTLSEVTYELVSLLGGTKNEEIINSLMEGVVAGINILGNQKASEGSVETLLNLSKAGANLRDSFHNIYFTSKNGPKLQQYLIDDFQGKLKLNAKADSDSTSAPEVLMDAETSKDKKAQDSSKDSAPVPEVTEGKPTAASKITNGSFVEPPTVERSKEVPLGTPPTEDDES